MTVSAQEFGYICELVRRRAAIVLEPGKEYLVESRLLPVARTAGEKSISALINRLRRGPEGALHTDVVDALTTNETSWFRDRHPFDALVEQVLPDLAARRGPAHRLTVWCAACSSGQEPYTIAMCLSEALASYPGWSASILATDLSGEMLRRAADATYSQLEVNRGLPATALVRHFERVGAGWRVAAPLRRMVSFRPLNLAQPFPAMAPADVVFLRNVLIYFDAATKRQVLARVKAVLRPDGYLFLGAAETTLNLDASFERVTLGAATAYRLRA